ncbi:MAG: thioredoxin family protein [Aureispira sp.]|nr:thioredoxin family protein [Aureispira sp.]
MNPNKVLYFHSDSCAVAGSVRSKIKELLDSKYPNLDLIEVNTAIQQELAASHQIFIVPSILVFFEGKEYFRFARHFSMSEIDSKIERVYNLLFS